LDLIAAIKTLIATSNPVTWSAVRATVAAADCLGITGMLAFDGHGDATPPTGFSLYTCDGQCLWHFVTAFTG
jgi:hypothetical protein